MNNKRIDEDFDSLLLRKGHIIEPFSDIDETADILIENKKNC